MKEEENSKYIVDTSVIIKWLVLEEKDLSFALGLLNDFINRKIHISIPIFVHWEINNFLGRNLDLERAIGKYSYFKLLELSEQYLSLSATSKAFEIMKKFHKVSFYDASYHAMAIEKGMIFITADKKYYEKTKDLGSIMFLADYNRPFKNT